MLVPAGRPMSDAIEGSPLWINIDRLDELYATLKQQQMERARAELAGADPIVPEVRITADLYTAFYGVRKFGARDPNGVEVMFAQRELDRTKVSVRPARDRGYKADDGGGDS